MKSLFCLWITFFTGLITLSSWAQNPVIQVNHLNMEDGLSFRHVTCLVQDSSGMMWIGTRDGLNSFDGYQFTLYQEAPNGLLHSYIHDLDIDPQGQIWIANEGGLNRLNPQTRQFESFNMTQLFPGLEAVKAVYEISILPYSGRVFLMTRTLEDQAYLYDLAIHRGGDQFERFLVHDKERDTTYRYLANVFEDRNHRLWIRPTNTLEFLQVDSNGHVLVRSTLPNTLGEFNLINALPGRSPAEYTVFGDYNRNQEFIQDTSSKNLQLNGTFCDSRSSFMVMCQLDSKDFQLRYTPELEGWHMPVNQFFDREGNYWYQQDRKIIVQRMGKLHYSTLEQLASETNVATYFYQSRDGTVWMGSNFGLHRFLFDQSPFQYSFTGEVNENGYGHSIRSVAEAESGELITGVVHEGVFLQNEEGLESVLLPERFPGPNKTHDLLPFGLHYQDSLLWISNRFDPGILVYDRRNGKLDHLLSKEVKQGFGTCLLASRDGLLLQGTDQGLNRIDPIQKTIEALLPQDSLINLSTLHITALFESQDGYLWIGTNSSGLFGMAGEQGKTVVWNKNKGLASNSIQCISESEDWLWVGTPSGLNGINRKDGTVRLYTTREGLPNNQIHAAIPVGDKLWITTNQGLSYFDPGEESFRNYGTLDGLPHEEFNFRAFSQGNQKLHFGSMNGVVSIPMNYEQKQARSFPIMLTRFEKFDAHVGKVISSLPPSGTTLELYPGDKFFSFQFASTDLFSSQYLRYAYRLTGLDKEWTPLGTDRQVRFNRLPPGNYQFEVKAQGRDGIWSTDRLQIPIRVYQEFYTTWWFILLCLLAFVALVYGVYRYRIFQYKKLESLRLKIASDLHDDVGSLLTRISMKSDLLEQGVYDESESKEELQSIRSTSQNAVSSMRDIVWSIDSRKDRLQDLTDRMKDFAAEMLGARDINFTFNDRAMRSTEKLSIEFRHNAYLIFKESIHNICKHSNATEVSIELGRRNAKFFLVVADNGTPPSEPVKSDGQGLSNMQLRAQKMGGEIRLSHIDGYRVELSAPW